MNFADTTFDIEQSIAEWKAEKIAKNFYAKWNADEATDADVAEYHNRYTTEATTEVAEVTTEVAEVATMSYFETHHYNAEANLWVNNELSTYDKKMITRARNKKLKAEAAKRAAEVATEVTTEVTTLSTSEAFGIAWGADGEVLTYDETTAAIDAGRGWFDTQGRWVNKARLEKEARAIITSK